MTSNFWRSVWTSVKVKSKKYFYFTDFFAKIYPLLTHVHKTPPLRSHYVSRMWLHFSSLTTKMCLVFPLGYIYCHVALGQNWVMPSQQKSWHFLKFKSSDFYLLHCCTNYKFRPSIFQPKIAIKHQFYIQLVFKAPLCITLTISDQKIVSGSLF